MSDHLYIEQTISFSPQFYIERANMVRDTTSVLSKHNFSEISISHEYFGIDAHDST